MKLATGIILASLINQERALLNLNLVTYDKNAHKYLQQNITDNSTYFYESGPDYKSWSIEGHTRSCDLRGCFINFESGEKTYNYMFRDTMKDSIVKIFRYRIAQKNCKSTDFFDGAKCSWKYAYYDTMMQNYTSFACKIMDGRGKFLPASLVGIQNKNFWCFFDSTVYYWNK